MKKKSLLKNKNGITLIALVITIIVLLILAGISLTLVLGDNGILNKTIKAKEENRGASVEERVNFWKSDLKISKMESKPLRSTQSIVEEIFEEGLITEDEKDKILGNEAKGIEGEYKITIGSRTIDFYTDEYRDGTAGLYATKTNTLLKSWDELIEEGYITVQDNVITACQKTKKGDLVIAEGITKINDEVFSRNSKLTEVIMPNTMKEIGYRCFLECRGLTKFVINSSIEKIGSLAFQNCTELKEIRIQNSNFIIDIRK